MPGIPSEQPETTLFVANAADGSPILAAHATRDAAYTCPGCGDPLSVKAVGPGPWARPPHFAHKKSHACGYEAGETEVHQLVKAHVVWSLNQNPHHQGNVDLEFTLDCGAGQIRRPDVLVRGAGTKLTPNVAIEIQYSEITPDQLSQRTADLRKGKAYVLWLPVFETDVVPDWWLRVLAEGAMDVQGKYLAYRIDLGSAVPFSLDERRAEWQEPLDLTRAQVCGVYALGWIKRNP